MMARSVSPIANRRRKEKIINNGEEERQLTGEMTFIFDNFEPLPH